MRRVWGVVGAVAGLLVSSAAVVTADSAAPDPGGLATPLTAAVATTTPTASSVPQPDTTLAPPPQPGPPAPSGPLDPGPCSSPEPSALDAPEPSGRLAPSPSGSDALHPSGRLAPIHLSEATLDALRRGESVVVAVVINLDDLVELHEALSLAGSTQPGMYDPDLQARLQPEVDGRAANVLLVAGLPAERVTAAAVLRPVPVLRAQGFDGRGPTETVPPVLGAEANLNVSLQDVDELCALAGAFDVEKIGAYETGADFGPGGS